jgi:hypothetical protein
MWHHVISLEWTDVSDVHTASIIRAMTSCACGAMEVQLHAFNLQYEEEVSNSGNNGRETGWAPEPVWTQW